MADDIFVKVREEILKEDAKSLPWVPKHLDKTWETQAGIAGAIAGAWAGAAFGAHLGLAGAWGAIAGTIPCAIVGGVIGYFSGAKIGSKVHRDTPQIAWTDQRGPAAITTSESTKQVQSSEVCTFCNARKSTWWDNKHNKCYKCGKGPDGDADDSSFIISEKINPNKYTHCVFCYAKKSTWWDSSRNQCGKCGRSPQYD